MRRPPSLFGSPAHAVLADGPEDADAAIVGVTVRPAKTVEGMGASRFDSVARALARGLPLRRLLRRLGVAGTTAVLGTTRGARSTAARTARETASTGTCYCTCHKSCQCRFELEGEIICSSSCIICTPFPSNGVSGGGTVGLINGEAVRSISVSAVLGEAGQVTDRGTGLVR